MDTPQVSVVIPAYRSADFIGTAIESALAQTMRELELVVVDDGSDDGTAAVAEAFAARDDRVRVLRNERNLGSYATVNRAIAASRGTWIAQLDADDSWREERLQRLLAAATDADVVSDDIEIVGPEDSESPGFKPGGMLAQVGLRIGQPTTYDLVEFIHHDPGLVHPMIRRAFLVEHGLRFVERPVGADFELWVLLLAHGARWVQLPDAYYAYTRGPNATTRDAVMVASDAVGVDDTLAANPLVAKHPGAVRALRRRTRLFRSHVAHRRVRALLADRKIGELLRLLAREPGIVPLLLWRKFVYVKIRLR